MRRFVLFWVLIIGAAPVLSQQIEDADRCRQKADQLESPGFCTQSGEDLGRLLRGFAGFGFSGAVLVARGDTILLHEAYGLADSETGQANLVSTRFPMLSITKTMVATALLRLADEKKLDLDSPLPEYFGEFPKEKSAATTHDLLTHTAGLIKKGFSTRSPERDEFVKNVKDAPIDSPPATRWRYSNAGYSFAAALIEVVGDSSWEKYLSEVLFVPAGMESAAVLRGEFPVDVASGHRGDSRNRKVVNFTDAPPYVSELWWGAAGATGVVCSVADVYRWLDALAHDGLVSIQNRTRMMTAHIQDQGYGLHVDDLEGRRRVWKGGGAPMYETQMAWYPDDEIFVVIAMNDHVGWRVPVWSAIESLLFSGESVALPEVVDTKDEEAASVAGRFRSAGGEEVHFTFDAGVLQYEPVDISEMSPFPSTSIVMRSVRGGGFAGVEVVPSRSDTPVIRLTIDNGSRQLILPDGTVVKLAPVRLPSK